MTLLIMGIGDAASHTLNQIAMEQLSGIESVLLNTHTEGNQRSFPFKSLLIGEKGLGAGGNPSVGHQSVEYSAELIHSLLKPVSRLILIAGFGGGTGTGAAPAIARYASAIDIETVGVISLPFKFEGDFRWRMATQYLPEMRKYVSKAVVIDSNDIVKWMREPNSPSLLDAYHLLSRFMAWNVLSRLQ
jgi:cell division protein FtsZ